MNDPLPRAEQRNPVSRGLGELPAAEVIAVMNKAEHQVLAAVEKATPLLARAARRLTRSYRRRPDGFPRRGHRVGGSLCRKPRNYRPPSGCRRSHSRSWRRAAR